MELRQEQSILIEEPAMTESSIKFNTEFSHGKLLLTAEKVTLAEELKILIRKLWN